MATKPGAFSAEAKSTATNARLRAGRANRAAPEARPADQRERKHNRDPAASLLNPLGSGVQRGRGV